MNSDILEGNWTQLKGKIRERWGKLTDDDLDKIEGKREQLVGKIQERYGETRDAVMREVDRFQSRQGDSELDEDLSRDRARDRDTMKY